MPTCAGVRISGGRSSTWIDFAPAGDDQPLDDVLDLAHVARPGSTRQSAAMRLRRNRPHGTVRWLAVAVAVAVAVLAGASEPLRRK